MTSVSFDPTCSVKRGYAQNVHYLSHNAVLPLHQETDQMAKQRLVAPKSGNIKGLTHRYTKSRNIGGPKLNFYNENNLQNMPTAGEVSPIAHAVLKRNSSGAKNLHDSANHLREDHHKIDEVRTSIVDDEDLGYDELTMTRERAKT